MVNLTTADISDSAGAQEIVSGTGGDTFVSFPASHVLFMGDVMAWNMAPFLLSGGASLLPTVEEKLIASVKGVNFVVEGHGYLDTWQDLVRITHFNRDLVISAKAAYDRSNPPSAAVAELKNPAYAPLLDTRIKDGLSYGNTPFVRANMNVHVAYAEFAGETVGSRSPTAYPFQRPASIRAQILPTRRGPTHTPVAPRPPLPEIR